MPTVYLTGPIKGLTYQESIAWRTQFSEHLKQKNITCISPMRFRKDDRPILGHQPGENPKNIVNRDLFDVQQCDLVVANFFGADVVSFGTVFELGYAYGLRKPVVLCIDKSSQYDHCFLTETSSCIVYSNAEALDTIEAIFNFS